MKKIIYYTGKDVSSNLTSIVLFIGQLVLAVSFIFIGAGQLISNHQYANLADNLYEYDVINFNVYYGVNPVNLNNEMEELVIEKFKTNKGFSFVNSLHFSEFPNVNVVVGLGEFGEIFDLYPDKETSNDPLVLLGSGVSKVDVGEKIPFGVTEREELVVNERLPQNTSYLQKQTYINLDDSIVILTTLERFNDSYKKIYNEEIITNMGLINTADDELQNFIEVMSQNDTLDLSPVRLNTVAPDLYSETKESVMVFFVFFLLTIIFIGIGIISSLIRLVDNNLQEYAIHRLYGATLKELYLRTVLYVLAIVAVPFIFSFSFSKVASPAEIPLAYFIIITGACVMVFSYFPLRKLKKQELTCYIRRDY
ncbi:hypothetical protein PRVXT_000873 [Proteinivorax tanatarense]|uniref:ABC transporter permease n=1 Tax=Proteinivorax tanatarense TaxID=1260629 RepID=A0AAU7VPQ2_9FIRM